MKHLRNLGTLCIYIQDILILDRKLLYDSIFLMSFGIKFFAIAVKYFPFKIVLTFGIINFCFKRTE